MAPRPLAAVPSPGDAVAGSVVFLFLGELFLIPHLLPIAVALARMRDAPRITLLVITSIHEEIIVETLERAGVRGVEVRRAHGFRRYPPGDRDAPALPWKIATLARNGPSLLRYDVAVVTERTSLWMPRAIRGRGPAFIYNEHGAGPHANFASRRNRYASHILMPARGMAERMRSAGFDEAPIDIVGYVKRDFLDLIEPASGLPPFPGKRPVVVYVPHWMRAKSSWWDMGDAVLDYFAKSDRYNLILAPHARLPEVDPEFERRTAPYRDCANIHIDTRSFRLVDQSYTRHADIYLGDGSSQVVEYVERPRPALFLNPQRIDWSSDPRFSHWSLGEVVSDIASLDAALDAAPAVHPRYAAAQCAYVERMMGNEGGGAGARAAAIVFEAVARRRARRRRSVSTLARALRAYRA